MDFGIKRQMGEPQDVYDSPENLFAAKFLGTPPINIFDGEIKNKKIRLNGKNIGKTKAEDQKIVIGIRPEGFTLDEKGTFKLTVDLVETIGRDTSLIIIDPTREKETFRAIVDSKHRIKPGDVLKVTIKADKLFIFNAESGDLIA